MQLNRLWIAVFMGCAHTLALAAGGPADPAPSPRFGNADSPPWLTDAGPSMLVKNAPYSAEIIKERQQNLGDGNQIMQRTTALAYRDSAGRTREEFLDDKGEAQAIIIRDPVAGVRLTLWPRKKIATSYAVRAAGDRRPLKTPDDGRVRIVERDGPPGGMTVQVTSGPKIIDPASSVMLPQIGPVLAGAFSDMKWSSQSVRRDLGTRETDGVKANGRLRSYEIPAGAVGNRNAILVSDEIWYAPDLRITVSSKHSDPRSGDSVFRIENLKRQEPDAGLFLVPSDYKMTNLKELAAARKAGRNTP